MSSFCETNFRIVGDFDPIDISDLLALTPESSHKIGTLSPYGHTYNFSCWEIGFCNTYDVYTCNQMSKSISLLLNKVDILKVIHQMYKVEMYLQIHLVLDPKFPLPAISPSFEVIDFCHEAHVLPDYDVYIK